MTRRPGPRWRRVLPWLVVALAVPGGCAVDAEEGAVRIEDGNVPYRLLDPGAAAVVPQPSGQVVTLCLLEGDLLHPVHRRLDQPATLTGVARAVATVTDADASASLRTSLGGAEEIAAVSRSAGVATVELSPEASQRLTADPLATVAQLVCTLTAQPGIGLVRFTMGDVPVEVPRADGSLSAGPVSEDDYAPLYAPVG